METAHPHVSARADEFVQRFSATRRGARLARRLVAYQLDVWGVPYDAPLSEKATLVTAELAANAALHGRISGRDFELRLSRLCETGRVRIEVSDTHPAWPVRLVPTALEDGGRGLVLVGALALRWGVRPRLGPGKTVWAEVDG
ncbi:ATP-binding protein [Streptomyces albus subsp. chlorinus]|uniref:ATP-binding protein n=1 Tax=Streptomyces albus TaxID=1888 RepID=UPI00156E27B7|nr:ATP-binding protein [Streptomyces albus]NSC21793.1 ATP-binding protein [Streptomyces albus subsp. chlorinus]